MAKDHPWADHRPGTYNGLYYVSAEPDEKPEEFKIPDVKFGETDFFEEFKNTRLCTTVRIYEGVRQHGHR